MKNELNINHKISAYIFSSKDSLRLFIYLLRNSTSLCCDIVCIFFYIFITFILPTTVITNTIPSPPLIYIGVEAGFGVTDLKWFVNKIFILDRQGHLFLLVIQLKYSEFLNPYSFAASLPLYRGEGCKFGTRTLCW